MSRIDFSIFEKLVEYSNQVPQLVDRYENRDLMFINHLKKWIKQIEKTLKENNIPESSTFSNYRLLVLSVERGDIKEPNTGYNQRKKIRESYAIQALTQAQNSLQILIAKSDEEFHICKKILRKLILDAITFEIIKNDIFKSSPTSATKLWRDFLSNPKTSLLALQVLEIVNYPDALSLLILFLMILQKIMQGYLRLN